MKEIIFEILKLISENETLQIILTILIAKII